MSYLPENEPIVALSVPCDAVNILIDCDPRQYDRTDLSIAVGTSALTIMRVDEYPIQIRRIDKQQPLSAGLIGLQRPLDFVVLDYNKIDTEWHVPNGLPVKDAPTMDTFAMLITGFTKGKLSRDTRIC